MKQKEFIHKTDEILNSMSTEELGSCLHNIARKIPESKREAFLQLFDDCCRQNAQKEDNKKLQYTRLIPDDKAKDK